MATTIRPIRLGLVVPGMTIGRFAQWLPGGPQVGNLASTVTVTSAARFERWNNGHREEWARVCFSDGTERTGSAYAKAWEVRTTN